MNEKAKKYLSDILQAIDLIEEFISDVPTFEDYLTDQKTQSAVERQLGIIGEAVNRFRQIVEDHELSNAGILSGSRPFLQIDLIIVLCYCNLVISASNS
jgi:hypothetical protein